MTEQTSGGTGNGESQPDTRREKAAKRQRKKLAGQQGKSGRMRRDDLARLLQRRRESCPGWMHFEITGATDGDDVLHLTSELLAETEAVDSAAARDVVSGAGFVITRVESLEGRVVRIRQAGASQTDVSRLRDDLTALKVETSLAYVTPNKVVLKADETPERVKMGQIPQLPESTPPQGSGSGQVPILVLDTGIALCDRTDGWLTRLEQTPANRDPLDRFPRPNGLLDFAAGHGTFIAGLFAQVDPGLDLRIYRVLDTDGIVGEVDVACALVTWVREELEHGGKLVINLSLGTETEDNRSPLALRTALEIVRGIERERDGDVMLVCAAGNDGSDRRPCWPAAFAGHDDDSYPQVVAVAALDMDGAGAAWSTYGDWVTCSAPGEAVVSTFVTGIEDPQFDRRPEKFGKNAWAYWTGTSFAAPQVAAWIAHTAQSEDLSLGEALTRVLERFGKGTQEGYGTRLGFSTSVQAT